MWNAPYEFYPMAWMLILFLGCWSLLLVGRNIKTKSRLREREMAHRERIEAMQQGIPVPEATSVPVDAAPDAARTATGTIQWFRALALALGCFFFFTGGGMCIAFLISPEFREIWSVGFIPMMAGFGFLLFFALSRDLAGATRTATADA